MIDGTDVGYRGPRFGYARVPDQFTAPGLRPDPSGPVWRMDRLRDRFLAAFRDRPAP